MINFEKPRIFQEAVDFSLDVYKLTRNFPKEESFGITSQLRRAAVSISLNIAEGSSRTKKEFSHFLDMARGSCYEIVPLLKISLGLNYIKEIEYQAYYERIDLLVRKINALKKSINLKP
ncbi:hypothetical protein A3F02_00070 [Candidatus Curtissbacteria bacterium RIFCSPHIGHO2_12_FULL_38_9b]|uniref:Four helix bundle protein n=2 Tax=Candidatus Curtissiibacteriota TaxID=1752717 RepID=A0A1F5GX25_9BACT|nr:MAG: hypothetical protein A3A48_03295 [Candidatus Curtissbacteria bacterium RIFCSPLOWO2_01_FULL_37_9]OGD96470.1 MAG: hypothetical protein A3F02_00070 [Candidatus Curtissbacteria bacterium RIFCSPHIGHO2_12_FULL_38_9b]